MLVGAIEASPLTTPTLRRNISLRDWEKDFRRRHLLSSDSEDSPVTEGLPFDIFAPEQRRIVAPAWNHSRKIVLIQYDEEEPSKDD